MRALLIAVGSRGDVQPTLALALALRERGHDVRLGAPPDFEEWVGEHGVDFVAAGPGLHSFGERYGRDFSHPLRAVRMLGRLFDEQVDGQFRALADLSPKPDIVIGAAACVAGASIAERWGVPYHYLAFTPQAVPSANYPPPVLPLQGLPGPVNLVAHRATHVGFEALVRRGVNRNRARLGLPPTRRAAETFQALPTLVVCDPELAPLDPRPRKRSIQTGFLEYEDPTELAPELEAFLARGPAPLYAGFGSLIEKEAQRIARDVSRAARRSGHRLVFATGWSDGVALDDDEHCIVISEVNHRHLLPRCAAAIHHGGAGTTATVARAGIPQIVVPHGIDQPFWAHRVQALGLGPAPIPRRRLSAALLDRALAQLRHSPSFRTNARRLAERFRPSRGLDQTVSELERLAG